MSTPGSKKKPQPISFEKQSEAVQQTLLRGLAEQVNSLSYPKLSVVKDLFLGAGLVLHTLDEQQKLTSNS